MTTLILASNRLPVRLETINGRVVVKPTSGGLATGLKGPQSRLGATWIGWLGTADESSRSDDLSQQLDAMGIKPVDLSRWEVEQFYEHFSNQVLWPTFHYQVGRPPLEAGGWDAYRSVNEKFAEAIAGAYRPGDVVWIQDYHLMLVPALVRERLPDAKIGFFLHVPFPSSEVFSTLPWRDDILDGLLGASLIGFHTPSYLRHFSTSLRRVLGLEADIDRVRWQGRDVLLGVFPMGVDADGLNERVKSPTVMDLVSQLRSEAPAQHLLVGLDRLDYTKGIPRRLLAMDRLLERHPELVGRVRLIQVSAPSRETTQTYAAFRREVDEIAGRINGRWATPSWVPIHNMHRSVDEDQISALFRAADVMLVTPLRDGMNLVAFEFVASRPDEDGVLVLSEFAGAAGQLGSALHVNPYDIDAIADRVHQGLTMPAAERAARMRAMRARVQVNTAERWADTFLQRLESAGSVPAEPAGHPLGAATAAIRTAATVRLLLDYDGTLVPFAPLPELAFPDDDLLALLREISRLPNIEVDVVSGRPKETLDAWLGSLPIGLHAEHGLWSRWQGETEWASRGHVHATWKDRVGAILAQFTDSTPGSLVEEKTSSLAWHYRLATDDFVGAHDFGEHQARELRLLLTELLSNEPVQIVLGSRVVEVRPHGVSKGAVVPEILARSSGLAPALIAIGDDVTDEDLYAALPPAAITVNVGPRPSNARFRLHDHQEVRAFLRDLTSIASIERDEVGVM